MPMQATCNANALALQRPRKRAPFSVSAGPATTTFLALFSFFPYSSHAAQHNTHHHGFVRAAREQTRPPGGRRSRRHGSRQCISWTANRRHARHTNTGPSKQDATLLAIRSLLTPNLQRVFSFAQIFFFALTYMSSWETMAT